MSAKLNKDQVLEIFRRAKAGEVQRIIANDFAVDQSVVSDILRGRKWAYITGFKSSPSLTDLSNGEQVREINGLPGYYITSNGLVISQYRGKLSVRKTSITDDHYESVSIHDKTFDIHHLMCLTFKSDSYFEGAEVRHLDGNKYNNTLDNLVWGTSKQNSKDKLLHGTINRGLRHGMARLSEEDVRQILVLTKDGIETQKEIGSRFGVARETISNIVNGRTWGWLQS